MRSLRLVAALAIVVLVAAQSCDEMVSSLLLKKAPYGITFKPNLSNIKHTDYNVPVHFSSAAPGTYDMYRDQFCSFTEAVGWGFTGGDTSSTFSQTADNSIVQFAVKAGGAPGYLWTCCTGSPGKRQGSYQPLFFNGAPGSSLCVGNFICFPFDIVTGGGGGGDPVFFAFHSGTKFHWHGIGGKVFVVLSDPGFQFNAMLVPNVIYGGKHGTWMSAFGLRSHNASLVINANRTVSINGGPLVAFGALTVKHLAAVAPTFSAFEIRKNALHLHVPNWGLTISFATYSKNNLTQAHLNFRIEDMFARKNVSVRSIEGVLGGTYATLGQPHKDKCNPNHQGGCLVPYAPETYFVPSNDLLDTEWARSTYAASAGLATANVRSVAPVVAGSVLGSESHNHAH